MAIKSPTVLVVDDERHLCNILRRILKKAGYKAITAANGEAALRLNKQKKPNVILLDIMMPGINGREVCQSIRKFSKATRIIYFTAKLEPANPSKLKELCSEADALIVKPATSKKILSTVSNVL